MDERNLRAEIISLLKNTPEGFTGEELYWAVRNIVPELPQSVIYEVVGDLDKKVPGVILKKKDRFHYNTRLNG